MFRPRMMLDFTAYRETPELPVFSGFVEFTSHWQRALDMLAGLSVAVNPLSDHSYTNSFGYCAYLIPLAAVLLIAAYRGRKRNGQATPNDQHDGFVLTTVLVAVACLAPVHAMHGVFPKPWFFGHRHGLPLVLLLIPSAAFLLSRKVWARLLVVALLASGIQNIASAGRRKPAPWPGEVELSAWLDRQSPRPVSVSTKCRELALWTGCTFHWITPQADPSHTLALFEHLNTDYLIVYPQELSAPFLRGLRDEFTVHRQFGPPNSQILVLRPLQ